MQVYVNDETSLLKSLVFGIPNDFGGTPKLYEAYDPKSKRHILSNTFPNQDSITSEMNAVLRVFEKYDITVFRPNNIEGLNQIFARDIGIVIEDKFIVPNIIEDRKEEIRALQPIIDKIESDVVYAPEGTRMEGGDVMPVGNFLFIGYSEEPDFSSYKVSRTNKEALSFFSELFPNKNVKGFQLNKSDEEPEYNALHLDCCFQPVGDGKAVIFKEGFKVQDQADWLIDFYGKENMFFITRDEMYDMNSNFFSISPSVVISERNFVRLNRQFRDWGITVEEVPYAEIAKMEGLLRCSTMPLIRTK